MRQPTEICRSRCCQLAAYLLLRSQETQSVIARGKGGCSTCEESQCEQTIERRSKRGSVCVRFAVLGRLECSMLDQGRTRSQSPSGIVCGLGRNWVGIETASIQLDSQTHIHESLVHTRTRGLLVVIVVVSLHWSWSRVAVYPKGNEMKTGSRGLRRRK